ncbi:MAG: hypothetical protein NXY57DRAFT_1045096, partial [Lentinula lateritia]
GGKLKSGDGWTQRSLTADSRDNNFLNPWKGYKPTLCYESADRTNNGITNTATQALKRLRVGKNANEISSSITDKFPPTLHKSYETENAPLVECSSQELAIIRDPGVNHSTIDIQLPNAFFTKAKQISVVRTSLVPPSSFSSPSFISEIPGFNVIGEHFAIVRTKDFFARIKTQNLVGEDIGYYDIALVAQESPTSSRSSRRTSFQRTVCLVLDRTTKNVPSPGK